MTTEAGIYEKLNAIFQSVFDEDDLVVTPGMTASDVEGWDSLSHVQLVLAVSKAFGVKFAASEIGGMKTVGDLVALIAAKTSPRAGSPAAA